MTEINISENKHFLNVHRSNSDFEFEPHFLTQEAVDEQTDNYIAPLTKQVEALTQLIQRMPPVYQVNLPPSLLVLARPLRRPTLCIRHFTNFTHLHILCAEDHKII